jgi:membrane protein implicated in regulation of membrane protease activity
VNPLVKYSLARLVLFVAALALLSLAGAGRFWAIVLAAVISMLVAYVLLRPLREQAAEQLQSRVQRRLQAASAAVGTTDEQAEDAEVERLRSPQGQADSE